MGIEASAAQDAVTAIIKAFGKNVTDIEDVMDKLVLVGNNFPISVSQLAEGMNNAGSMLAVANNSFEQSIALLTAANTTVQNISKASTGLRTIAARIRKTTTGEGDDGEIVEEAKYQEMVNALTKQHVSLIDEVTGQYRSTYDIIRDIAGVWKNMTSMEQAAVVEALAGTRQQNIFASLMTQFGEAEEAMRRMDDSAGELQASYDIYLGSIQAHVQTLKAAFDELSRDFVDSGFAKGALDTLTKFVEALDWIISRIGVLGTVIGAIGLPIIAKNFTKIAAALSSVFKAVFLSKGWEGLLVMSTAAEKLSAVMTSLAGVAPVLVPLLAAFAAAAVAAKVIDGKSFESASEQVAATKSELDKLEQQQSDILARWNALNDVKARGDFSVQQETELTLLTAQKEALEAQVALLKEKYELEKAHEREAARAAVGKLLADADDPNGYSTEQAVAAYRDAKKRYDKLNIFGRRSKGAQNNLDAVTNILNGQIQTYQNALKVLDPEEDADEIARIKNDILEITSAISDIPIEVLRARSELEKLQTGGKVKLLQRPVIDAKILEAAGWGEFEDGEGATLFSSTYSNEDKTIAMNFTPIITDVDGNYIGAFTPEQLQQYAEGVIAGTQEDTLGLKIGATFEGPDAIEQAESEAQKVHELHELVYEQDLKKIQKFHRDVKRLSNDTMNAIKKYVTDGTKLTEQQARELQEIFDSSELSVENFSRMLSQMFAEPPDGLSKTLEKSIADLAGFNDELEDINTGFERFEKHMEGGEKDDAVKKAAEIYKGVLEDLQSDRVDTNRVRAAAELFLGKDRLKEIGYDLQKAAQELQGSVWQYLFDPNEESSLDYGQRFAEYVRQNFSQLDGVWVEGGNNFFYKNMQAVADAFDMSTESVGMFLSALDMYGVNVMRSVDDTEELINRFYELKSTLGGTQEAVTQVVNELYSDGYDSFEIYSVLDQLQQTGVIDLDKDQLYDSIDEALAKLDELNNKKSEPTTGMNYEPFVASYQAVVDMMKQLNQLTANPTVTMNYAERDVSDLDTKSNSSTNNNTQSAAGFYTKARAGARAGGKQAGSAGGKTLVNEDGPELISDDGKAFIANGGKPGFVYLTKDAIVFNAEDTDEILRRGRINGVVPAFAKGTGTTGRSGLIGRLLSGREYPAKRQINGTQVGGSSTSYTKPSQHSTSTHTNTTSYTTYSTYSNTSWICPNCGRLCGANASYCYGCGWPDHMQQELPQTTSSFYPDESGTMRVEYGDGQEYTYETGYDYSLQFQIAAAQRAHDEAVKALRAAQATNAAAQGYSITPTGSKGTGGGSGYAGSGGGNYVGGADYASASDPQKVDWVAVRINRLQRTIADLEKVASSGFKKLDLRLSKTKDQIAKTTEEIGVMNSAYNRYMQEANSVGLDSNIAGKVQNGTIDITEYDEETRKKIDEYTEW